MESFQELIRDISDSTVLLTPNEKLANKSLFVVEALISDLNEYIITNNFDEEQIWGQISIISKKLLQRLEEEEKQVKTNEPFSESEDLSMDPSIEPQISSEEIEESEPNIKDNTEEYKEIEDSEEEVNDDKDFFDSDEMVRFADEGELEREDPGFREEDEEADEEEEEEEGENVDMKYEEFYKDHKNDSSEEEPEKVFSLIDDEEMERLEKKLVSEKPWQLKGEIASRNRPRNSLLNEEFDFDLARNPAPQTQTKVVTDEVEDIIKQRVLDMLYDDVKPKRHIEKIEAKTTADDFMDYEKSKKSLAELYEEDFKKNVLHVPINTELEKAKKEITVVFRKLCYNLDTISSLNPVPKPVVKEITVKNSSVPALVMEEVLPFGVSKELITNPEEVFKSKDAVIKSNEELTKADKNTARKRHKATLRTRRKERIMKVMNKLAQDPKGQKFEYRRMVKEEKAKKELIDRKKQPKTKFTRSSEFFKNMQELSKEIDQKTEKKKKDYEPQVSKKIKL